MESGWTDGSRVVVVVRAGLIPASRKVFSVFAFVRETMIMITTATRHGGSATFSTALGSISALWKQRVWSITHTETRMNPHTFAPSPVLGGFYRKVNQTARWVFDGARRVKHLVHFRLYMDIDFPLCPTGTIPSSCSWSGSTDINVVLSPTLFKVHPAFVHCWLPFIFIRTLLCLKRLLDDNKHTGITGIVAVVTFNQYMETSIVLRLVHLSWKTVISCVRAQTWIQFLLWRNNNVWLSIYTSKSRAPLWGRFQGSGLIITTRVSASFFHSVQKVSFQTSRSFLLHWMLKIF